MTTTTPENENAENAVIKCKDGSLVTLCGDGELTITANGKNGIKSGATTDEDGEASLTIRDLTLNIDAPVNDAINAEQFLNVESGTLTIDAADDAIHCDLVLNIGADGTDGPTIDITNCCEGLEGAELNVCSGDITINASDDCLNAANSDLTDYDFTMTISGGAIDAYTSGGDGFDSNGDLTITGGVKQAELVMDVLRAHNPRIWAQHRQHGPARSGRMAERPGLQPAHAGARTHARYGHLRHRGLYVHAFRHAQRVS